MALLGVIYKITFPNLPYFYIGSSTNFAVRKKKHLNDLKNGKHHSQFMQRVFSKHGQPVFSIIEEVFEGNVYDKEQMYLDKCISDKNCMNTQTKANGGLPAKVVKHPRLLNILDDTVIEDMECTTQELADFIGETRASLRLLLKGDIKFLHGWVLLDSDWRSGKMCRHFGTLLRKGSEVYMIRTLDRFHKENNIQRKGGTFARLLTGEEPSYYGWRLV